MNQILNIEEEEFENYIYQLYQQYFSLEEKGLIPHTTHSVTDSVNFEEIVLKHKEILHHQLQKAREESGKRNAVVKEYKDEGVMFILKVEDGKTYEASMPIPKWAEVGKLTLRDDTIKALQDKK